MELLSVNESTWLSYGLSLLGISCISDIVSSDADSICGKFIDTDFGRF